LHDIRPGDIVIIEKGGEIIPKIVGVDISQRIQNSEPFEFITHCPECHTKLIKPEGEVAHYCPNENCTPQLKGQIEHFISRKAMNIEGLGEETVNLLFEKGMIRSFADLYKLKKEVIVTLEGFRDKSAENILAGLEKSKEIPFHRVLFALGIRFVGETVAKKLVSHFKTIDRLIQSNTEELLTVNEIGDKIAASVISYFQNPENISLINELKNFGLQFEEVDTGAEKYPPLLKGKNIVITGSFDKPYDRKKLEELVENYGGKLVKSISKNTTYIVRGNNAGPEKMEKAASLNIKIISKEDFLKEIKI